MAKTTFEAVQHPHSKGHKLLKVTTASGRVYACASASDDVVEVTKHAIQYLWKHSRYLFLPYNEATGCYVGKEVS